MNRFIKTCRIFLSICSALALTGVLMLNMTGCSEETGSAVTADEASVSLRLEEVFQDKAYVRLCHDGSQEDFWLYAVTKDMLSEPEAILTAYILKALETDGEIEGNIGTNKSLTLEQLEAKTSYRVVASRVLADGNLTGNAAELVFTTLRDPDVFEVHPSWSIRYKERRAAENNPDEESEVFECATGDSEDTYVPCLLSREDFETAYGSNLRTCFEDYIAYRNLESVRWADAVTSKPCEHLEDRLRHGEYVIFMIGIDAEGELTGYYSRTDCTIAQETASDAYRRWVGKWNVSGSCGGQRLSYEVEIAPDENNLYYRMYGWESTSAADYFSTVPQELPLLLYFEKSTGSAYVVSEELDDLADPTLADFYEFFLYGCVEIDYNGVPTEVPVDISNLRIARFTLVDDEHAKVAPEKFSFDMNGVHYDASFLYFNYSYTSQLYSGLVPVTSDSIVPRIGTMTLERL